MTKKQTGAILGIAALAATVVSASALLAMGPENQPKGKETTLKGRLVDLHNFMTDGYASADRARITRDAIRSGVPAALETEDELLLVGMAKRAEQKRRFQALAYEEVEIKGMVFEKKGLKYMMIASMTASTPETGEDDEDAYPEEDTEHDTEDTSPWRPDPEDE